MPPTNTIHALAERVRIARYARDAQIAALPPQPVRAELALFGFGRRPYIHAREIRNLGLSVGADTPSQHRLRTSPAVQAAIADQFPDRPLEDLLIARELPADVADAVREYWASLDPTIPGAAELALYKPSGISRTLTVYIPTNIQTDSRKMYSYSGPSMPAPAIVKQINWSAFPGGDMLRMRVIVDGYGIVAEAGNYLDTSHGNIGGAGGMNHWVLNGAIQPRIEIDTTGGGSLIAGTAHLSVVCESLIKI